MYISILVIQILNFAQASLDCSTIKGTALNSYAYKRDGSVQFEFTILTSGIVELIFPTFWTESPSISPLINGTTTCRETMQSITCIQNNLKFTCGSLRAGNQIIRCNNIMGPHTNKQIGNFSIQFAQQSCDNILINNFQPYGGSVVFLSNSTTALYPNTDKLQMIWENIVLPITFSTNPQIEVQILSNGEFVKTIKGYVYSRSISLLESLIVITPQLIKAQMPYVIAIKDVSMKLYLETLKVMGNTQPIQSQIDFKDSNGILQYQILFPTIQVQTDQLTAVLNIDQTEINIYAKYTFSITIKNALNSAGFVRIALKQALLSSNLICYCDNELSIPNINTDYIDIGGCLTTTGTHNIIIQNVLNPKSTISSITIQYIETIQDSYSVDRMTNFQYKSPQFTPGTLNIQYDRIGSDLDIVGGYSYFTLKLILKNGIPAQGLLRMEIPQEIKFVYQNAQICNVDIYGCQIQIIQDQVLIFKFQQQIEAQKSFIINQISIPIRNPYDTSQTNYFKFSTYDQFNNIIDTISNVQGYAVNTRSSFDGLIIIESDQPFKNGQSNTLFFTMKTKTPQFYPIQMFIKVGDLTINNNPLCKLEGALIKNCTKISNNQLYLEIESNDLLLLPTTLKLSVSTIKCKDTMTKSQDFEFSTQSTNGQMSYQQGPYISNIQFGDITQTELIVDKQYYGASNAIYQFNFVLQNGLTQGDYQIHILFPFNLPLLSGYSCKDTLNNKLMCNVQSNNILILTGPFDQSQLQYKVIINGLPTPLNEQQPRTFSIKTYRRIDNINYLVDSSINGAFQFSLYCPQLNNCRTCKIIESDINIQCESCYTSIISKFSYMKQNVCVDQCGDGYYQNEQEFVCLQCPENCQVCQLVNNNLLCDKCFDNYKYQDSICVDRCQDTYYLPLISNNKCEKCDNECVLCSMNSSYCSKCQANIPIKDNKCYKDGCLRGYYQTYDINQILTCELCPSTCINCISYNQCIECQPKQYYLSGQCISDCPIGYFIDSQQMQCKQCVQDCNYCQNETTCVKCFDGYLLKEQLCVLTCGEQYYIDHTQTSCLKCNQYCQTCELQNDVQMCTSCIKQYFFSNFTCVQQCESNYYDLNNECFQCSQNCLTCSGKPNNCTSCLIQADIPQFLDGTTCVSKCQDTQFPDITTGKCISCPNTCIKCTSLTNCTQCNQSLQPHYLIQGACRWECPYNYQPIGLNCELIQQQIVITIETNKYIPVPHVILFAFLILSVLLSKQFLNDTYIAGSIIGLSTPLIWSSWLIMVYLLFNYYEFRDLFYFWILIGSMGLNYIFNILHLLFVQKQIWNDQDFVKWQNQSLQNKVTNFMLISFSIFIAYPLYKLIMSRYFGFSFFKAKIMNIKPLNYFNYLNVFYIIFVNIPIIISCIFIIYNESSNNHTQTYISAIDSIIVTMSNILLLIWETYKNQYFFHESNYYLNESKQHLGKNDISGYFQHPYEQKSQAEQKIDISVIHYENDKQQSQEQSCNLNEISIILSDKNSIPVQYRSNQIIQSNITHTIYYKNILNNQLPNPDDEPPQVSSVDYSSEQSFNHDQCHLKDISLIQNQEEQHQNSQLSIFDEQNNNSYNNSSSKKLKQMQDNYNDENNSQQINQQIQKTKSSYKKIQSQSRDNNNQILSNSVLSQQSSVEITQSQIQQLSKSAQFIKECNKTSSFTNKVQQQQQLINYNSIPYSQSNNQKEESQHSNNQQEDQEQKRRIADQQLQFDTEGSNDQCRIQILKDSRAIEQDEDALKDSISIQQMKSKQKKSQNKLEQSNIFDSNDSIHTMSDQDWESNQISPSEFNTLNQRFENESELDLQINMCNQNKTQSNYKQNTLNYKFRDENNYDEQQIQTQINFTKNYQQQKEIKKQQLQKIYLHKLSKNEKVVNRQHKSQFKKKNVMKNHPKDISDAYIDDQVDVEDINF